MHAGQVHIDVHLARRLIGEQFPQWRDDPVSAVPGSGTVNAIFRIGSHLAARFPLQGSDRAISRAVLVAEASALTDFAAASPFASPTPVVIGRPGHGYPLAWSVQTWIDGDIATPGGLAASESFARDLAVLITALRSTDTRGRGFSGRGRGGELRDHDEWMAQCVRENAMFLDAATLRDRWAQFRALPSGRPLVMTHGDLTPVNLVVAEGRLIGVLDGGGFGPTDPALDLVGAWHMFDGPARSMLRAAVGSDDIEWARGAAWAFEQAMGLVWYYRRSNPAMSALGRSTLARILTDPDL